MCFEENAKWKKIYLDTNGRGLYGEMRHHPRNRGKINFDFMSYGLRVIGKNVKRPHGGAITGLSGIFWAEVHCWHPRSVCAQFRSDRTSGTGD